MDGISAAGSVAGIAAAGIQLSKFLYDLYSTIKTSSQEIQDVANNVSLLAMVLEELDEVLYQDQVHFRPQLQEAAQTIAVRCADIFEEIRKQTGINPSQKGRKFSEKAAWYFKRERVKPLRVSLESLKSTLNILLHVIQLAKTTNNVEEYPGVKPIGHWYVRKERRGLVCLVIDNRHTVDKLELLENESSQTELASIEEEIPLSFADIFPVASPSNSSSKRGESPERKFVISFRPNACSDDVERQEDFGDFGPNPSSAMEDYHPNDFRRCRDADSENHPQPNTSQLILDIIPHRKADAAMGMIQYMAGSVLLEAKAEETVDMLMRQWTYLDPKYFSDDDRPSTSSAKASSSSKSDTKRSKRSVDVRESDSTGRSLGLEPGLRGRKPYTGKTQVSEVSARENKDDKTMSPRRGRRSGLKKGPGELPSARFSKDQLGMGDDSGYQSAQIPSSPAPPYVFGSPSQCPNCDLTPSPSLNAAGSSSQVGDQSSSKVMGKADPVQMDRASEVIAMLTEMLKQSSMQKGPLNACDNEADPLAGTQTQSKRQQVPAPAAEASGQTKRQSTNDMRDAESVTLIDCLGRRFIFPVHTCRIWQDMENLIKKSFLRFDAMAPRIIKGQYDIIRPTGEIILPDVWSAVVKPGWTVELRFWPCEETEQNGTARTTVERPTAAPSSPSTPEESSLGASSIFTKATKAQRRYSLGKLLSNRRTLPNAVPD